jgi:hypothetical protein
MWHFLLPIIYYVAEFLQNKDFSLYDEYFIINIFGILLVFLFDKIGMGCLSIIGHLVIVW